MKKRKCTGEEHETDPFGLLPDELCGPANIMPPIFNKVADLKCLCQCSLVSKHFASVISHVSTVSLTVSGNGNYSLEYCQEMKEFAGKLYYRSSDQIPSLLDSLSVQNMKLPSFLQNFKELKFIYLNYEHSEDSADFPFPAYKVKFSSTSAKLERFVALIPHYIHKDTENESDEEKYMDGYKAARARILECIWQFNGRYVEWMCYIIMLVKCHTSLERVTVTDSKFNAKLVVGDGKLINTWIHMANEMVNRVSYKLTLARGPVLHLPQSGYVFRRTIMLIISAPEDPLVCSKNFDEIIDQDFKEKLMVLREAVKENHEHEITMKHV